MMASQNMENHSFSINHLFLVSFYYSTINWNGHDDTFNHKITIIASLTDQIDNNYSTIVVSLH